MRFIFFIGGLIPAFFSFGQLTYIKAGKLIDVEKGIVLTNQVIVIEADTIKATGVNIPIPSNANVIDLSKATVLPGLIDCHTHINYQGDNYYDDIFRKIDACLHR